MKFDPALLFGHPQLASTTIETARKRRLTRLFWRQQICETETRQHPSGDFLASI